MSHYNLLKTLWLQRLPAHVQGILQSQADLPLPRLTELANKIFDVTPVLNSNSINSIQSWDNSQVTSLSQSVDKSSEQVAINARLSSPRKNLKDHSLGDKGVFLLIPVLAILKI